MGGGVLNPTVFGIDLLLDMYAGIRSIVFWVLIFWLVRSVHGQTNYFPRDTAVIQSWAKDAVFMPGWIQISDKSMGKVQSAAVSYALGAADISTLSLGDSGQVVLTFDPPIANGQGSDFVVFENGFKISGAGEAFLEYAHVEVSSDGRQYVAFPSRYLGDTLRQVAGFGAVTPAQVEHLAGGYPGKGTGFDLEILKGNTQVDIARITHLRLTDVVGSIQRGQGTRDSRGYPINDPFPTPFSSAGFDLDAVGVIHTTASIVSGTARGAQKHYVRSIMVPQGESLSRYVRHWGEELHIVVYDLQGARVFDGKVEELLQRYWGQAAVYMLELKGMRDVETCRLVIY